MKFQLTKTKMTNLSQCLVTTRVSFYFNLSDETCLTLSRKVYQYGQTYGLDSFFLNKFLLVCFIDRFYFDNFRFYNLDRTQPITCRFDKFDNLSILLDSFTWNDFLSFGFSQNLQRIFLSLKDLRNYKCFSPTSNMK